MRGRYKASLVAHVNAIVNLGFVFGGIAGGMALFIRDYRAAWFWILSGIVIAVLVFTVNVITAIGAARDEEVQRLAASASVLPFQIRRRA